MPTLEELLADSQLTDDIKISLPGGKEVTVKDLRAFAATQKSAAEAAQREYAAKVKEADAARVKAERLATDSLALWEEATKLKTEGGKAAEARTGDIDWDNDPVYRPIHQRLTKMEKEQLEVFQAELEKMKKALGAGFRFVTDDYQQRRWDALPKDSRPKDKTWRDYLEVAQKANIKDQYGLDDPIEAFNRSTAADRDAARLEAARKAGIEEGKKQAAVSTLPRPGGTPHIPRAADKPQFKDLRDAMAAAASDPEILRIANGDDAVA
jgi:hypothetical protein